MAEQGGVPSDDLVAYEVLGWRSGKGYGGAVGRLPGTDPPIPVRISVTSQATRPTGGSVAITVRRRSDGSRKEDAVLNPLLSVRLKRRERDRPDIDAVRRQASGLTWRTAVVIVDGVATTFEVCDLGDGMWAAVGETPQFALTLAGDDVPLSDIELVQATEPLPPLRGFLRPPSRAARFPDELRDAPLPATAPPGSVIDLAYSDGRLTGSVGSAIVDLAISLPRHSSTARGSIGGEEVTATWHLGNNAEEHPDISASLEGAVGLGEVNLKGSFHLEPDYFFDRAQISGVLAGRPFTAEIERAEGGFMTTSTVKARGTIDESAFQLFGTQTGELDHAIIRGTYDNTPVYLDLRTTGGGLDRTRELRGTSTAPSPFIALIAATLAYFS